MAHGHETDMNKLIKVLNWGEPITGYSYMTSGSYGLPLEVLQMSTKCHYCGRTQLKNKDTCPQCGGEYRNPVWE
jgi:hypothetical protein